ncbi:hypothetical protein LC724_10775 [Blautia sp. RD014234]|nr:hypothetical protein [Blautia parvula]
MAIEEDKIRNIYEKISSTMNMQVFIIDNNDIVISSADLNTPVGEIYPNNNVLKEIQDSHNITGNNYHFSELNTMIYNFPIEQAEWKMAALIPLTYLQSDLKIILKNFLW